MIELSESPQERVVIDLAATRRRAFGTDSAIDDAWAERLDRDKKGAPYANEANVLRALRFDPALQGLVAENLFTGEQVKLRAFVHDPGDETSKYPRRWTDEDTTSVTAYIQSSVIPRISSDKVDAAIRLHAATSPGIHPIRDYLTALVWDQRPRVAHWLVDYMGATSQDERFVTAAGQAFFVSAVARVMKPGCQVDTVLVLEGKQGIGKSSALRTLGGDAFSENLPSDLDHKDTKQHVGRHWLIEFPEIAQIKGKELDTVKSFITRRDEDFRAPYGRYEVKRPRQCVFIATTNDTEYLIDSTGNRRFHCVVCGAIDLPALQRDRDQLWAEAVELFRCGTPWHLSGEVEVLASAEAESRVTSDPWLGLVEQTAQSLELTYREFSPGEVLDRMDLDLKSRDPKASARVGTLLRQLWWEPSKRDRKRGQLFKRKSWPVKQ